MRETLSEVLEEVSTVEFPGAWLVEFLAVSFSDPWMGVELTPPEAV